MKTTFVNDFHDYMVRFARPTESIPTLPLELVCNIMSYLECLDLMQCQLVCKIFRKLILETSRLSYIIDLHKYRMVSVVSSKERSTHMGRLALLQERERNWRMLGWKNKCTVDLPPTGSLYEFVGGVYANGREGENRITASISFLELPSAGIPSNEKEGTMVNNLTHWTHFMPDYNIIDFTMDPVQDLLVLVVVAPPDSQHVYDLHIRSIKTNQPHPRAPKSVFPCLPKPGNQPHPFDVVTAVRVQVCGGLVALLIKEVFDNSGGYLEIWNWNHGPSQSCRMPRAHGIDDFTFLTKEVCLVVRPTGRFEVYDFVDPIIKTSEPVLRYAYAFPPLSAGYTYWYISLSSNPTPGYVPSSDQANNMEGFLKGHQQIHYPKPEERVHACCLYVFNPADPVLHAVSSFVFFIKIDTLLHPPYHWFSAWEYSDDANAKPPYYNPNAYEKRRILDGLPPARGPSRRKYRDHEYTHPEGCLPSSSLQRFTEGHEDYTDPPINMNIFGAPPSSSTVPVGLGTFINGPHNLFQSIETYGTPGAHQSLPHPLTLEQQSASAHSSQAIPALENLVHSMPKTEHGQHAQEEDEDEGEDEQEYSFLLPFASSAHTFTSTTVNPSYSTASASPIHSPSSDRRSISPPPPESDPNPDPATCEPIPWAAWGPQNTRWFEECLSTDWQHAIYGMRAVESVEVTRMSQERQFRIHEWPVGGPASASNTSGSGAASAQQHSSLTAAFGTNTAGGFTPSIGQGANLPLPSNAGFVSVVPSPQGQTGPQPAWDPLATIPVDAATSSTSTQSASAPAETQDQDQPQQQAQSQTQQQHQHQQDEGPKREKRFLRVRDFSPYALTRAARAETKDHPVLKGKGKCRAVWRTPKVVKDASRVQTKGVFKEDIMSSLPYVETVTDETFDVTDVMMDDCRLLLLKRGPAGRINQMEVLMM